MTLRGIKFLPVDINISSATTFDIEDGALRIPFCAVDGLGEAVALDIVAKRNESPFTSKKDVQKRTRLNQTLFDEFDKESKISNLLGPPIKSECEMFENKKYQISNICLFIIYFAFLIYLALFR